MATAISSRSSSVSSTDALSIHPSTCSGERAPTMAPLTPGQRVTQATATAATVAPRRAPMGRRASRSDRLRPSSGSLNEGGRRRPPSFNEPELGRNLSLRDALRPIGARRGATVAAVAVAWVTRWPGVSGAIVGARSPEQVDGWIESASLELTDEDLEEIAGAVQATGAGEGPADPRRA